MSKPGAPQRRRRPKSATHAERQHSVDQYSSRGISRALDVLECFPDEHTILSLKDLGAKTDLPESSLFRILLTLESRGYLAQANDGTYRLTPKLLFGKVRERAERIKQIAKPHLQSLAMRFDETASLSYLFEDRIQVVDTVETLHAMRLTNRPGRVLPPHCSSMGKSITAFQAADKITRILEVYGLHRRTPNTIVDRPALLAEYELIRSRGYAFDREEAAEGGFCVGAPIQLAGKPVVAAVSLSIPLVRHTAENEAIVVTGVVEAARAIAQALAEQPG